MRQLDVYNSKNVFLLVGMFILVFGLLYALANFVHESQKINHEIDLIRAENERSQLDIDQKTQQLSYLNTEERIEKDAKTQLGRKRIGEEVLVIVDETPIRFPITTPGTLPTLQSRTPLQTWKWMFWDRFQHQSTDRW